MCVQAPGNAYDPSVPGVQFFYDYIIPSHPNAVPSMKKLYPGTIQRVVACSGSEGGLIH